MYSGKIGPTVLTGGAVVAGTQSPLGAYLLIGVGLMVAALIVARVIYRRRHASAINKP